LGRDIYQQVTRFIRTQADQRGKPPSAKPTPALAFANIRTTTI